MEFRDDVRINNGALLDCGSGHVFFSGKKFEIAPGGMIVSESSTLTTTGPSSMTLRGDMQLGILEVRNRDTLVITNSVHILDLLDIGAGSTVFVKTTGLLTVDGPIIGDGSVVYESALPVQMSTFTAVPGAGFVQLRWATVTEADNAGWEVERRVVDPGATMMWRTLGFVEGAGTYTSPREYVYRDATPFDEPQPNGGRRFAYRLKQVDRTGAISHSWETEVEVMLPSTTSLEQNFPNPFNPSTTFRFTASEAGEAVLTIHDILGRTVTEVHRGPILAGQSVRVTWDASGLASGVYLARLSLGQRSDIRRIILTR